MIVVNPIAGGTDKQTFLYALKALSEEIGFYYEVVRTRGAADEAFLKKQYLHMKPCWLIAAGGDGTFNLVARVALQVGCPVGIVPMGSANGLARELGMAATPMAALRQILRGHVRAIDVLWINQRYLCIHMGDVGINADMVSRFQKAQGRGWWGYARHLISALWRSRARRYAISDLERGAYRCKRAHMVVIANASSYGTGALINPDGRLDDGFFELCIIKRISLRSFVMVMLARFVHKYDHTPNIEYMHTRRARIQTRKPVLLQLDGEVIGRFQHIDIEVTPGALPILVGGS